MIIYNFYKIKNYIILLYFIILLLYFIFGNIFKPLLAKILHVTSRKTG